MKILIIGETCTDVFCYGNCTRLEPAAPVPIFQEISQVVTKGMAQHVANNLHSLQIEYDLITNENEDEIKKIRYVDDRSNHMFLRVDMNDTEFPEYSLDKIRKIKLNEYKAIIISDYNKGFLSKEVIRYILESHPVTFLDTKKILGPWAHSAKFIKINSEEYRKSLEHIDESYDDKIIVTLGKKGCKYNGVIYPVENVAIKDVSGAGDTFLAALVSNYVETDDIYKAITYANKCSTKVVQNRGMTIL